MTHLQPATRPINFLFFDLAANPLAETYSCDVPSSCIDQRFQDLVPLFAQSLRTFFAFQADATRIRFWKPIRRLPMESIDADWIEKVGDIATKATRLHAAQKLKAANLSTDDQAVHLILIVEEIDRGKVPGGAVVGVTEVNQPTKRPAHAIAKPPSLSSLSTISNSSSTSSDNEASRTPKSTGSPPGSNKGARSEYSPSSDSEEELPLAVTTRKNRYKMRRDRLIRGKPYASSCRPCQTENLECARQVCKSGPPVKACYQCSFWRRTCNKETQGGLQGGRRTQPVASSSQTEEDSEPDIDPAKGKPSFFDILMAADTEKKMKALRALLRN
ncbi:hypothetical protein AB1N83_005970 [Pleurotus pulmonarius]